MTSLVDLNQLRAMGLVAANPLVRKEITLRFRPLKPKSEWQDPAVEERVAEFEDASVTVFLRRFTAADRIHIGAARTPDEIAYISIQRSVYTENGMPLFPSVEEAYGLDLDMFAPLMSAIQELNGLGASKKSQPRPRRGATSRSPSAGEASPNGKSSSRRKSSTSGSSTENATAP